MIYQYELHIDEGQKIIDFKGAKKTAIKEAERLTLKMIRSGEDFQLVEVRKYQAREDAFDGKDFELAGVIWSNQ